MKKEWGEGKLIPNSAMSGKFHSPIAREKIANKFRKGNESLAILKAREKIHSKRFETIKCMKCDREFEVSKKSKKIFCGVSCASSFRMNGNTFRWKNYKKKELKECLYCSNIFEAFVHRKRKDKFCSHKCYSLWLVGKTKQQIQELRSL